MRWELILFLVSAIQGLILSLIFIFSKGDKSKKYLGLYLLCFSLTILHYVRYWNGNMVYSFPIMWVLALSNWLMPPAIYLYFSHPFSRKKFLLHLTAPFLFSVWMLLSYTLKLNDELRNLANLSLPWVKILVFVFYCSILWKRFQYSRLNSLMILSLISFTGVLILYHISLYLNFYTLRLDYIACAFFIVLTYAVTYFSQAEFLTKSIQNPKYATSSLSEEDGKLLVKKIRNELEMNKPFLDTKFNLTALAQAMKVPKYRISQALNEYSTQSFSELVNEYRVNEAKEKLVCNSTYHLKIDAIGETVGFNNKVSFYKHFKHVVGVSPGQFRERALNRK